MSDDLLNQGCIYKFLSNFYFLPSSPAHRIDLRRCCLFPVPCTGLGWEEAIRGFVIYSLAFSQVTQGPPPTPLAPDVLKTKVNEQNPSLASLEASAWRVANTENLIFLRHCTLWSVCSVLYFFFPFSSKMALMLPVTTTRMRGGRGRLPEPCALGWHLCQHPLCGALRRMPIKRGHPSLHLGAPFRTTPIPLWAWKVQSSCGKEIVYSLKLKKRDKLYSEGRMLCVPKREEKWEQWERRTPSLYFSKLSDHRLPTQSCSVPENTESCVTRLLTTWFEFILWHKQLILCSWKRGRLHLP